jgi:hypothetical protein
VSLYSPRRMPESPGSERLDYVLRPSRWGCPVPTRAGKRIDVRQTLAPEPPVGGGGWVEGCYQTTTKWGRGVVLVLLLGLCEPLPITCVFGSPETDTTGAGSRLSYSLSAAPVGWSSCGGVLSPQARSPLGPIPLLGSPLTTLSPSRVWRYLFSTAFCNSHG